VVRSDAYTADSAIIPREFDGAITGYDMVVRAEQINPLFLSYCILSDYVLVRQLYLHCLRATQPHLNREELGETIILVPDEEEQLQIVNYIQTINAKIDGTISKLEKEIVLLNEYCTVLISEVVTGKVDIRG
jgi:type I restriction enzyme S subunit